MLKGICPVIPTLFTDDDLIDPAAVRRVVRFALDAGADGIVFPGVASEYNFLTAAERDELMEAVAEEVAGKVPLIGGASAATSRDSIEAALQAMKHGITHLMIMAPAGIGGDVEAQKRFFSEVTGALSGVEIILQNAPSPIGAGLDATAIAEIIRTHPMITYTKEETLPSGPVISSLQHSEIPHLKGVLGGGGCRYLIDELERGAIGALPAVELTDLHVAIYKAHCGGEAERARALYRDSLPLLVTQMIYRMRLTKYVLMKRGVSERLHVRASLPPMDTITRQNVDAMLSDLIAAYGDDDQ